MKILLTLILLNFILSELSMMSLSLLYLVIFFFFFFFFGSGFFMLLGFSMMIDNISLVLVLLTLWVFGMMVLSILGDVKFFDLKFKLIMNFMLLNLVFLFLTSNCILFYILFEMVLIPMILMIYFYGIYYQRYEAGLYMFFYTIVSSMPFFFYLFVFYNQYGSFSFFVMNYMCSGKIFYWFFFILAFLVKLPMFGLHLWLPKAHSEAPVCGSMLLAAVLLKMGVYGGLRFFYLMKGNLIEYGSFFISWMVVGSVFISLLTMCQVDLKVLVAYSSVAHMGICMCGVFIGSVLSMSGSLMSCVSHGLVSSGLFVCVNVIYKRLKTRSMLCLKGLNFIFPTFGFLFMMFILMNFSFPPFLSFWGEILLVFSLLKYNFIILIFLAFIILVVALYSLYLYVCVFHGENNMVSGNMSVNVCEYLLLSMHLLPMLLLVFNLDLFIV